MKIYLNTSEVSCVKEKRMTNVNLTNFDILGVLETSGEDFESADDIFEAIGAVLGEVANEKTEDDIKDLCDLLLHTLKPLSNGNAKNSGSGRRLLDAPVHMGAEVAKNDIDENLGENMWIQKVESNLVSILNILWIFIKYLKTEKAVLSVRKHLT
jgi:hypothetical protein